MDVRVSGRNLVVTDEIQRLTQEKIGRLDRFLKGLERAEVHFIEERNPRISEKEICEVTLEGHGHHVRCKVRGTDPMQAVDRAVETLEHQLHKLKTKLRRYDKHAKKGHAVASAAPLDQLAATEVAEELGYRVVKVKAIEMNEMTPAEAAVQMDLVGHPFYFFHDADSGAPAVVYRRDDGDVGVLVDRDAL